VKNKSHKKFKHDDSRELEAISDKINARKSVLPETVLIQIIIEILFKMNTPLKSVTGFRLFATYVAHK